MFSKAKIKRFNEEVGCAPPPTKYTPKLENRPCGGYLDRSSRFKNNTEVTPFAYVGVNINTITPNKRNKSGSVPRLYASSASTISSSSQSSGFRSPLPFARSNSCHATKCSTEKHKELLKKYETLLAEKKQLQDSVSLLEDKLHLLKIEKDKSSQIEEEIRTFSTISTQVESCVDLMESENSDDQPEDLTCHNRNKGCILVDAEEMQLLRDQIDHLTMLRDNLESSVVVKDKTISDLQIQIDLVVAEAEENREEMQMGMTCDEKNLMELQIQGLMARYQLFLDHQLQERLTTKDILAQKDIEIELMNDSIDLLNTQISEYERTVRTMHCEVDKKKTEILSLHCTIGDLAIASKEKEVMETVLEDEIKEKNKEVNDLFDNLNKIENELDDKTKQRDQLLKVVDEEKNTRLAMKIKLEALELSLKEKEVLQQFLEKEVVSREAEVSQVLFQVLSLEKELKIAEQMAVDLQLEAEERTNLMIGLRASITVKQFDLEEKEYVISTLQEQITELKEAQSSTVLEDDELKASGISQMEDDLILLKTELIKERKETSQLEERIVDLTTQISLDNELKMKLSAKENEIEEITLKYSDALLEQESCRRMLSATTESLDKEKLLLEATERELESVKNDLTKQIDNSCILEASIKEIAHKLIHIEDALACEEAEANVVQEGLQMEIEASNQLTESLNQEKVSLQSSNEGFMGQINQLKIDMVKKSMAVDDMQTRIDEFRDETNHLQTSRSNIHNILRGKETLLDDLQNEFETRLKIISNLQDRLNESQIDFEDLQCDTDRDRLYHLRENEDLVTRLALAETSLEKEKRVAECQISLLEEKLEAAKSEDGEEKAHLKTRLDEECVKNSFLKRDLDDAQRTFEERVNDMQSSLLDKTTEAHKMERTNIELNESYREKVEKLQGNIDNLVQETAQLSCSLTSKDELLDNLNQSVSIKSDQIENLQNNLEKKQMLFSGMEKRVYDLEKIIDSLKGERDEATNRVSSLEVSLNDTKDQIYRMSEDQDQNKISSQDLDELRSINDILHKEVDTWRNKFLYLEMKVEPFKHQLDCYELEKVALLSQSSAAQEEVSKLSGEYAKLLGHNNHKQKIQHVVKLKTENNELREKVHKLQLEVEKQKKSVKRLEDRLEIPLKRSKSTQGNKENTSSASDNSQVTSAPLKPANHYRRL